MFHSICDPELPGLALLLRAREAPSRVISANSAVNRQFVAWDWSTPSTRPTMVERQRFPAGLESLVFTEGSRMSLR